MDESQNPYSVSVQALSSIPAAEEPMELILVSGWIRFVGYVIDSIVIILLCQMYVIISAIARGGLPLNDNDISQPSLILPSILYYFVAETTTGRTIGKLITGTRVVNENGMKPSPVQTLKRSLARLIPFDAFSFIGGESRGWHDSIAKTCVIKAKRRR